jgi:hypothetical protein
MRKNARALLEAGMLAMRRRRLPPVREGSALSASRCKINTHRR